jgi:AcrR family transcriptional regulator
MTDTDTDTEPAGDAASRRNARREAQNALGREHVLDAAEEVFSRKGFHEATIKEIARVAEFSVGAVYGFFENKDDLFVQVMERRGAALVPAMHALLDAGGPAAGQLHALADLQIGFFRAHPAFARLFVRATGAPLLTLKASVTDATRERYDEAMGLQADLFVRGQAAGELVPGPPGVLSEVFSSMVLAFQSHDPETIEPPTGEAWSLEELHALLDRAFVHDGGTRGSDR